VGAILLVKRNGRQAARAVVTLILAMIGLAMLLPLLWMISASMKPEVDVFKFPIEWIPRRFQMLENYRRVWLGQTPFTLYYLNSFKVTLLTTGLALVLGSLGAYGFAKVNFRGRDKLFLLVILAMIIPEQITLLPRFMYFKWHFQHTRKPHRELHVQHFNRLFHPAVHDLNPWRFFGFRAD